MRCPQAQPAQLDSPALSVRVERAWGQRMLDDLLDVLLDVLLDLDHDLLYLDVCLLDLLDDLDLDEHQTTSIPHPPPCPAPSRSTSASSQVRDAGQGVGG